MLELRPTCENCDRPLPPASLDARICSFECTFCADCVASVLNDVCPNCGGGFTARPVRPAREWRKGVFLGTRPAGERVVHQPVDRDAHAAFAASIAAIPPHQR
jgi:uncharacterized protein